jgi:hypothetical protein
MGKHYLSRDFIFSIEAMVCLNVLCLCLKNWVLGNLHTPLIIDMNCNSSTCDWSDFSEKVIEAKLLLLAPLAKALYSGFVEERATMGCF